MAAPSYHPCPVDALLTAKAERKITNADVLVFLAVLRHCDVTATNGRLNGAYPALTTIAQWAGTPRRYAQTSLERLVAAGLLMKTLRPGRTSLYAVPMPLSSLASQQPGYSVTTSQATERPDTQATERPTTENPLPKTLYRKGGASAGDDEKTTTPDGRAAARELVKAALGRPTGPHTTAPTALSDLLAPPPPNPAADAHLAELRAKRLAEEIE